MKARVLIFLASAIVAVTGYWLVFALRYGWYLRAEQSLVLNVTLVAFLVATASLWLWYPSRLLTAIGASVGPALPALAMPTVFPPWELGFASFAVGVVALCVLATHLRRVVSFRGRHAP